jgi:hypothetical protein
VRREEDTQEGETATAARRVAAPGGGDGSEARGSAWRRRTAALTSARLQGEKGWGGQVGAKSTWWDLYFFWRGSRGPPEMEACRGNLEGYAKWRLV